ncbi:MAG: hypothetical protein JSV03_11090 [Planctomycetota bacterium]|nr:MAG: hypothetical protein JSV03_11090 [Planctomycetota bacterium]
MQIRPHLSPWAKRIWDKCLERRYQGTVKLIEYGLPLVWWCWTGRLPRTNKRSVFLARMTTRGRIRTKLLSGTAGSRALKTLRLR